MDSSMPSRPSRGIVFPGVFLNKSTRVAVDSAGDVYVADWSGFIRKVWVKDRGTTTIAGSGILGYSGDGPATNAMIAKVTGMAMAPDENFTSAMARGIASVSSTQRLV
jgi:hypothetical protein